MGLCCFVAYNSGCYFALIIFLIVMLIRKYVRFRHSIVGDEDVIEELGVLQRQVIKLTKEKDEIMAMKVAQIGVPAGAAALPSGGYGLSQSMEYSQGEAPAESEQSAAVNGVIQTSDVRFSKLIEVDNYYKTISLPIMTTVSLWRLYAKITEILPAHVCTFITT